MHESIIDPTFGISSAARAVMALLDIHPLNVVDEGPDEKDVRFTTYTFYHGREKGITVLVGFACHKKVLVVSFGECASSDSIYLDSWTTNMSVYDPPTWRDRPDEAEDERYTSRNPQKVADKAITKMRAFYKEFKRFKRAKAKTRAKRAENRRAA